MNNLSDIFGGKVPGLNAPLKFRDALPDEPVQSKGGSNQLDMVGLSRASDQRGLSLFGDVDKDKTFNVFDCEPYNKLEQAVVHKVGAAQEVGKVTYQPTEIAETGVVTAAPTKGWEGFKERTGVGDWWARRRERKEQEREALMQARTQALKEVTKEKVKADVLREKERLGFGPQRERYDWVWNPQTGRMEYTKRPKRVSIRGRELSSPREFVQGFETGVGGIAPQQFGAKVGLLTGFGGGMGAWQAVQQPATGTFASKVYESVGGQPPPEGLLPQPQQIQPQVVPPVQPLAQPPIQPVQPQFQPQVTKYSPYSKRPVSYTRGPYRKRR